MKPAACTGLLLLMAATASAQFTLTPQVGLDQSKTSVRVNQSACFSPAGSQSSLKAALRMDYRFARKHDVYFSVGTSPSVLALSFSNPAAASTQFKATRGDLQWQLEAGYQYTAKTLRLKKNSASLSRAESRTAGAFGCGARTKACTRNTNLFMRLQPALGLAYRPSVKNGLVQEGNGYRYNAGNWRTAIVPALSFEFDKGRDRVATARLYYMRGLGGPGAETLTSTEGAKTINTSLRSHTAGWGLTLGIPFSLAKTKRPAMHTMQRSRPCMYRRCGHSCVRHI